MAVGNGGGVMRNRSRDEIQRDIESTRHKLRSFAEELEILEWSEAWAAASRVAECNCTYHPDMINGHTSDCGLRMTAERLKWFRQR